MVNCNSAIKHGFFMVSCNSAIKHGFLWSTTIKQKDFFFQHYITNKIDIKALLYLSRLATTSLLELELPDQRCYTE